LSLYLEDFGRDTKEGLLIVGGRVEIARPDNEGERHRDNEWGEPRGSKIREQLLGMVKMWHPKRNEWGMGSIYLHLKPYKRAS
jgi:hypothetical protein